MYDVLINKGVTDMATVVYVDGEVTMGTFMEEFSVRACLACQNMTLGDCIREDENDATSVAVEFLEHGFACIIYTNSDGEMRRWIGSIEDYVSCIDAD